MKVFGMSRKEATSALQSGEVTFAVYGLGKMGLPLALSLAEAGGRVLGADVNAALVESLNAGRNPLREEPGTTELVEKHVREGRLRATTDLAGAAASADVMVILVPTFLREDRSPDLSAVEDVCRHVAKGLRPGALVIQESTLPPGSTENVLRPILEAGSGLKAGVDFGLAFCPERTLSGRALADIRGAYPKVVGGVDPRSTEAAAGLYEAVNAKGVLALGSATAAEAVKVFEGLYRDVNIALANELATVCEEIGVDAAEVFAVANTQPYSHLHKPGCGVGGHCIPVYPYFVSRTVRTPTPLIQQARLVNDAMPAHTVGLLEGALAARGRDLAGARVLVVGLTYRPGVRETRHSPGLDIVRHLQARGADVAVLDPLAAPPEGARAVAPGDLRADAWDGVVLTLEDPAFRDLPWTRMAEGGRPPVVVDARRALDAAALRALGYTVLSVGGGQRAA